VSILTRAGWRARTPLATGLREAYRAYLSSLA
jgi:hypothetical protein